MAEELGRREDAASWQDWIKCWKQFHNPESNLLKGRWVEANDRQGAFGVSHDIPGLSGLMGGDGRLADMLNSAFKEEAHAHFVFSYGRGKVSYANQPGCSNAHVFNHAGRPWLSQYWVRRVSREAYGATDPNSVHVPQMVELTARTHDSNNKKGLLHRRWQDGSIVNR